MIRHPKPRKKRVPDGYVYFIYSAGFIKIGYSDTPRLRHMALDKGSAFRVHMLQLLRGTRELERSFHARFAEDRQNGEWFRLSPVLRAFLLEHLSATVGGEHLLARAESEHASWLRDQQMRLAQ